MNTLDEIGTLYTGAVIDEDGNVLEAAVALPGWHVNSTPAVAGWEAYAVEPSTPRRVFAGADTTFYTFDSLVAFEALKASTDLVAPAPPPVPQCVTLRQARLALLDAGKYEAVEAAIAALPEPARGRAVIEWYFSSTVERNRPIVAMLGQILGFDDARLDELFIDAAARP